VIRGSFHAAHSLRAEAHALSAEIVHAVSSPAYGAAKAGVTQLSKFLAYELGPFGITTNNIAPLTTLTPRVKALRSQEDIDRIALQVPMRRLATEDDHVYAMLYLDPMARHL
jgi:3-oxoacyl-[acyl-carrier protein] reductase